MKTFLRKAKIVRAEPMREYDFLLQDQRHHINGARKVGHRPGFKIIGDGGAVASWLPEDEFHENYVEIQCNTQNFTRTSSEQVKSKE